MLTHSLDLENNICMAPNQFGIFDKLAAFVEIQENSEYHRVAKLRAQAKGAPF